MRKSFTAYMAIALLLCTPLAHAEEFLIGSAEQFRQRFTEAQPGDRLVLLPGTYPVDRVRTHTGGLPDRPITVTAQIPEMTVIQAQTVEAMVILHPYWSFENLVIHGNADTDHAFHLSGKADYFTLKNSTLKDFHAHIKSNGTEDGEFPDHARIINNTLSNSTVRDTATPVTLIDVVGGKSWLIKSNVLIDFAKGRSDQTSYGMFLKGNSRDGEISENLVICSQRTMGGIRVGLSLGGGGTGKQFCEGKHCTTEHRNGVIRNNVILNCSDVGIYLNKASNTLIEHNTLLFTSGIDVRFAASSAHVENNIVSGAIRSRDDGLLLSDEGNITTGTTYGMLLPSINRKLQHRISDYDTKYPSLFDRDSVVAWQQRIDRFSNWLAEMGMGLGKDAQAEMFPFWDSGNLTPAREWIEPLTQDAALSGAEHDFWGAPRARQQTFIGAIDYGISPCELSLKTDRSKEHSGACLGDTN